jgi:DNA-binding CsgD family transcriptional regulator
VKSGPALDNLVVTLAEICTAGMSPAALRKSVLPRMRRAVPFDALWWALVDPATLLFTQTYREEIPFDTGPYFVENEFLGDDVNKWNDVAHDRGGARTLIGATAGEPSNSARYRDVFEPLGLEDELRVVLRSRGSVWGFMCLHREQGAAFSAEEVAFTQRIAPHLAEGIRLGLLVHGVEVAQTASSPGLILLATDGSVIGTNTAADQWLDELDASAPGAIPLEVHALTATLRATDRGVGVPQVRVRTRAGRWAILQASWMPHLGHDTVAVIIQQATADQVAPVVMSAYGLTEQEQKISGLVFHGLSTHAISEQLHITQHTIQDHLKSIFEKTGVRSRRELVATVLRHQYLPRAREGEQPGPFGGFPDPTNPATRAALARSSVRHEE